MTRERGSRIATASKTAKEQDPREATTHILMTFETKSQEDLYRADGMLVASRQSDIVRFGNDIATAQSRLFLNEKTASAFLRRLADVDMVAQHVAKNLFEVVNDYKTAPPHAVIEERNAESLLALPGDAKVLHN